LLTLKPQRSPAWWVAAVAITVVVVVLSTLLSNVRRDKTPFDIYDEGAHYDYVVQLENHHVPAFGDPATQSALLDADCIGSDVSKPRDCSIHPRDYHQYPAGGYSYEAQQPPLAYLPYTLTTHTDQPPATAIVEAREGGVIWTAIAAVLLLLFAGFAGLPLLALTLLLATCLLNPTHVHAAATINNDASAAAAGALALLVATLSRDRGKLWLRIAAGLLTGVVIGLLKGLFVLVPFALLIALLVSERPWRERLEGWRRCTFRNASVVAMLAGSGAAFVGWFLFQSARATVRPSVILNLLLGASKTNHPRPTAMFDGLQAVTSIFDPSTPSSFHAIWNLAFFAVVAGVLLVKPLNGALSGARALAAGALVALIALAVGWPLLVFVQGHFDYAASGRYALPLVPILALVVVRAVGRYGLLLLGVGFPLVATILQLKTGKY